MQYFLPLFLPFLVIVSLRCLFQDFVIALMKTLFNKSIAITSTVLASIIINFLKHSVVLWLRRQEVIVLKLEFTNKFLTLTVSGLSTLSQRVDFRGANGSPPTGWLVRTPVALTQVACQPQSLQCGWGYIIPPGHDFHMSILDPPSFLFVFRPHIPRQWWKTPVERAGSEAVGRARPCLSIKPYTYIDYRLYLTLVLKSPLISRAINY